MGIVVTLSRELGSGGERIACEVAEALHLRCLGSDLIHEAMRAGIPEDIALESEEGRQSFIQRAADFLRGSPSVPAPVTLTGTEPMSTHLATDLPQTDDDYYRAILESLIFDLAQKEAILLI